MRWGLALVVAAACHVRADEHATCAVVANRYAAVVRAALGDAPLEREAAARLPALRTALVNACAAGNWPGAVRDCMAAASDRPAFTACELGLGDDQRAALDEPRESMGGGGGSGFAAGAGGKAPRGVDR